MRAVVLSEFGRAPEVEEVAEPEAGPGEVRVRVHAASVNGFDLAVANGYMKDVLEHRFPVVLGKDFAGVVDQVGGGITEYSVGDRVFGVVTKETLGDGSFGEYVTVPTAIGIASLPDSIAFAEGAALGLAGTAAYDAVEAASLHEGETVLIAGATGGVGQQAVQLVVRSGASVVATASTGDEVQLVTRLGAHDSVDYRRNIVDQVLAIHPGGVDVLMHFAGDPAPLLAALKPGGRLVSTLVQSPDQVPADGITVLPIYANPSTATLQALARNHAEGRTTVTVQQTYPLDETPTAFEDFRAGTLGKLIVAIR